MTKVFADPISTSNCVYLVSGLQLSDDTQVNGGIAISVAVNTLFTTLDNVSLFINLKELFM